MDEAREPSDLEIAIQRLTHWINNYGDSKPKEFVGDVALVLLSAKESARLNVENEALTAQIKSCGHATYVDRMAEQADLIKRLQAENDELRDVLQAGALSGKDFKR